MTTHPAAVTSRVLRHFISEKINHPAEPNTPRNTKRMGEGPPAQSNTSAGSERPRTWRKIAHHLGVGLVESATLRNLEESTTIPRVPVHTVDSAPEASTETLEALGQRVGKVINIFGEMAHAPAMRKMYASVEQLLGEESSLEPTTRAAIHLTIANVNGCDDCQAAYTGTANYFNHFVGTEIDLPEAPAPD